MSDLTREFYLIDLNHVKEKNPPEHLKFYVRKSVELLNFNVFEMSDQEFLNFDFDEEKLKELIYSFDSIEEDILVNESPLDLEKLIFAIQNPPRNTLAMQMFTFYNCLKCNSENEWPNSAVPAYCKSCAAELAKKIILGDVFKDGK